MEDQGERSSQTFLVNNFPSLSSTATKTRRSVRFQESLNTDSGFKAAAWT